MSVKITPELFKLALDNYKLNLYSIHGIWHWYLVDVIFQHLATFDSRVSKNIGRYFALVHDLARIDEMTDLEHGPRSAEFIKSHEKLFDLDEAELEILCTACSIHTSAKTHDDVTVQVCMTADRLQLFRVNMIPDPDLLPFKPARSQAVIDWAYELYQDSIDKRELPDNAFGIKSEDLKKLLNN